MAYKKRQTVTASTFEQYANEEYCEKCEKYNETPYEKCDDTPTIPRTFVIHNGERLIVERKDGKYLYCENGAKFRIMSREITVTEE